jgi:hypothetical protein
MKVISCSVMSFCLITEVLMHRDTMLAVLMIKTNSEFGKIFMP